MELISKQGQRFVIYAINLNKISSSHTLTKVFEMSRKTPLTSIVTAQSKAEFISLTIDNYFEIMNHQGENQFGFL